MASDGSLASPYWSRLRDDELNVQRYYGMSEGPFKYVTSFGEDGRCNIETQDAHANCKQYHPVSDVIDASNMLRFGEPFETYEPGHSVSTELIQKSVFVARGEGMLSEIDNDSGLRPEPSNVRHIRARKDIEGTDLTHLHLPPLDVQYAPCNTLYAVVADNGEPRGGLATRVSARNSVPYVAR